MKENIKVKILLWIVFALFMIYILTLMVPLYYLILNSFKTSGDFVQNRWAFPKKFTFENFVRAFEMRSGDTTLAMMFVNSIVVVFWSYPLTWTLSAVTLFLYYPDLNILVSVF